MRPGEDNVLYTEALVNKERPILCTRDSPACTGLTGVTVFHTTNSCHRAHTYAFPKLPKITDPSTCLTFTVQKTRSLLALLAHPEYPLTSQQPHPLSLNHLSPGLNCSDAPNDVPSPKYPLPFLFLHMNTPKKIAKMASITVATIAAMIAGDNLSWEDEEGVSFARTVIVLAWPEGIDGLEWEGEVTVLETDEEVEVS